MHLPKLIAHRGASSAAPENSLSAIRLALASGVDYIEIDLRATKEHIPIVLHDSNLQRTGRCRHLPPVHEMPLEQIRQVDVGSWFSERHVGERIPTLEEVLMESWGSTGLMLEIKSSPLSPKKLVSSIFEKLLQAAQLPPKLSIGSFSVGILREIKAECGRLPMRAHIIGIVHQKKQIGEMLALGINQLAIWAPEVCPILLHSLAERGIETWAYTVDKAKMAHKLISMGISGIISNRVDLMHEVHSMWHYYKT
jgi:glycerophosphoryl diester phosphodiesterase